MSGICSAHINYNADCTLCNTDIHELIPNIDELREEARLAGTYVCWNCQFKYYLTTDTCQIGRAHV